MKLSVNEYAREFKISVQSVYQRIKRGAQKSIFCLIKSKTSCPANLFLLLVLFFL